MTIQVRNESNEIFYQLQKAYMFFLLLEIVFFRIFFRVGMIPLPIDVYNAIYIIFGVIPRYIVVFLNFILLGLIIFKGAVMCFLNFSFSVLIQVVGLSFVFSFFLSSYAFYFLNLPFPLIAQVIGLVVIGFSINYLIIQNIRRKEFAEHQIVIIIIIMFLIILVITFNLTLIHQIFFSLNSVFEIPYAFHGFMFAIAQLMTVFLIAPLFFALPFLFREKIEIKSFFKIIPIIIICLTVIIIIGFINSPIEMGETGSITPPVIFGLMVIFISGYTEIQSSLLLINWSIIALGLFALGCYFLWLLGKSKKNQTMKQYSYGMFVIFCIAFLFVEALDFYFLMVLLNGFPILTWRGSEF
jgi:hypothetical protein